MSARLVLMWVFFWWTLPIAYVLLLATVTLWALMYPPHLDGHHVKGDVELKVDAVMDRVCTGLYWWVQRFLRPGDRLLF